MIAFNNDTDNAQEAYGLTPHQFDNLINAIRETLHATFHDTNGPNNKIQALEHFYNLFQPHTPVQAAIAAFEFGKAFEQEKHKLETEALFTAIKKQYLRP